MTVETLEVRVFRRAAELLGDERALARHLRMPSAQVAMILSGVERPLWAVFVEAVDLLIAHGEALFPGVSDTSPQMGMEAPSTGDKQQQLK
jgi:hypothetical protein